MFPFSFILQFSILYMFKNVLICFCFVKIKLIDVVLSKIVDYLKEIYIY